MAKSNHICSINPRLKCWLGRLQVSLVSTLGMQRMEPCDCIAWVVSTSDVFCQKIFHRPWSFSTTVSLQHDCMIWQGWAARFTPHLYFSWRRPLFLQQHLRFRRDILFAFIFILGNSVNMSSQRLKQDHFNYWKLHSLRCCGICHQFSHELWVDECLIQMYFKTSLNFHPCFLGFDLMLGDLHIRRAAWLRNIAWRLWSLPKSKLFNVLYEPVW